MALKTNFEDASFLASPFVDEVANPGPEGPQPDPGSTGFRGLHRVPEHPGGPSELDQAKFQTRMAQETAAKRKKLLRQNKTNKIVRKFLNERGTTAKTN